MAVRLRNLLASSRVAHPLLDLHLVMLRRMGERSARIHRASCAHRPMRILADAPTYVPVVNAGSELTLHALLQDLRNRSHEVAVLVDGADYPAEVDGIPVGERGARSTVEQWYRWSDVVITQLGSRNKALRAGARYGRPVVQMLQMGGLNVRRTFGRPDLVVYNAAWRRDRDGWPGPSVVVHPRVVAADYRTTPGNECTLIGLSERKGVSLFYALAARCPERRFLGVKGGWGDQVVPDPLPANVTILENTGDMRSVYGRTRVLLLPSKHESFGRVAVEAGFSGIPTIANPGPGVEEALGCAGLFARADDLDAWVSLLDRLDDPGVYEHQSALAREQAESWDQTAEIDSFERRLLDLARCGRTC